MNSDREEQRGDIGGNADFRSRFLRSQLHKVGRTPFCANIIAFPEESSGFGRAKWCRCPQAQTRGTLQRFNEKRDASGRRS